MEASHQVLQVGPENQWSHHTKCCRWGQKTSGGITPSAAGGDREPVEASHRVLQVGDREPVEPSQQVLQVGTGNQWSHHTECAACCRWRQGTSGAITPCAAGGDRELVEPSHRVLQVGTGNQWSHHTECCRWGTGNQWSHHNKCCRWGQGTSGAITPSVLHAAGGDREQVEPSHHVLLVGTGN